MARVEIVSVGTELLLGEITDTNASYLAGQLPVLGLDLYWISQVGDNQPRLVEALRRAWQRSDLTLVTGGLGPTGKRSSITREGVYQTGIGAGYDIGIPVHIDVAYGWLGPEWTPHIHRPARERSTVKFPGPQPTIPCPRSKEWPGGKSSAKEPAMVFIMALPWA